MCIQRSLACTPEVALIAGERFFPGMATHVYIPTTSVIKTSVTNMTVSHNISLYWRFLLLLMLPLMLLLVRVLLGRVLFSLLLLIMSLLPMLLLHERTWIIPFLSARVVYLHYPTELFTTAL